MNIKDIAKKTTNENSLKQSSRIMKIIKGSIISIIITIVALIIFSIILANTNVNEKVMVPVITIITTISIFMGSIISVSKIEKKGILNGALVGLIYILAIYLISSIISGNFLIDINSIILIIVAILAGMIGGIIGVNIKH